jgi:hypothetical protein
MTRNRIAGAVSALALLAAPAVAAAHGNGDDHGRHHGHHHKHHGKKAHSHEVTGKASATIASFADGELTLALPSGKTYTADVTNRTRITCRTLPATANAASHGGGDDNSGPGKGDDDGPNHDANDDHGDDGPNHDANDDHGNDNAPSTTAPASTTVSPSTTTPAPAPAGATHRARCGTDALVAGAKVSEAKLSLKGDSVIWKKIAIVK